jgi:hypothetical protein
MRARSLSFVAGLAGLSLLVTACGGSKSPSVASVATTTTTATSGATPAPLQNRSPSQLLAEWAACMRSHGDPKQSDPTIDAQKVIEVTLPAGYDKGPGLGGNDGSSPCAGFMSAASTALRGGRPVEKPDQAALLKFSECMRANGIPDFPDPSGGGLSLRRGGDLDPSNPAFQHTQKLCGKQTGLTGPIAGGAPQPGMIKVQVAGAPQGG